MPAIFQPQIAKKINKALSVRVIVICCDHKLLRRDFDKGVGGASTLHEPNSTRLLLFLILCKFSGQQDKRQSK